MSQDAMFDPLLFAADQTLLQSITSSEHCLHPILLAVKAIHYGLRDRGHELLLSENRTLLHRNFFFLPHLFQQFESLLFVIFMCRTLSNFHRVISLKVDYGRRVPMIHNISG